MKKFFFISNLLLLLSSTSFSQKNPPDKFLAASNKDTAYQRFRSEVRAISKRAHGRTTLAEQAKQLFARNKALLNRVNTQYNRISLLFRANPKNASVQQVNPSLLQLTAGLAIKLPKPLAPYGYWDYVELANASTLQNDPADITTGKLFYHVIETTSSWAPSFKDAHKGFVASVTVPNDPSIIAARLKIEYSFFYTGWDTYGSNNGIELVLGPNKKFRSPVLDAVPDSFTYAPGYVSCDCKFSVIDVMLPLDSITSEIQEVHANKEGSFSVDGYVKPNDKLVFNIGIGYMEGSVYGINGQYLYGEFRLKKATITWLKTAN